MPLHFQCVSIILKRTSITYFIWMLSRQPTDRQAYRQTETHGHVFRYVGAMNREKIAEVIFRNRLKIKWLLRFITDI